MMYVVQYRIGGEHWYDVRVFDNEVDAARTAKILAENTAVVHRVVERIDHQIWHSREGKHE